MQKEPKRPSSKTATPKDSRPVESVKLQVQSASHEHTVDEISVATYSTLDIVDKLDIPRERLRDWLNRGFIEPTQKAHGQGTKALFTRLDVYSIELFRYLVEKCNFSREEAARHTKEWVAVAKSRKKIDMALSDLVSFERITAKRGKEMISIRSFASEEVARMERAEEVNWNALFVVNFRKIREEVDARLA